MDVVTILRLLLYKIDYFHLLGNFYIFDCILLSAL